MEKKIKKEDEEKLKEKTKAVSIKDGVSYSVMDGAGLRYITPYALSIGANNAQIGFLTSIPSLLGNFFQMFSCKAVEKYPRRKIVTLGVFLQALMWIVILGIGYLFFYKGFNHGNSATLVIIAFTILTIFGAFISPIWSSLIRDSVSKNMGKFFGRRNKIIGISTLIAMLLAGFILSYFKNINLFFGFVIIFGMAFFARLVSLYYLTKYYEPKLKLDDGYYFRFGQFVKKIPKSNFGKFTVFVSLIMFGTYIASPFFSVYMLSNLHFNYFIYTLISISNPLGTLLFMPFWGKIADRFGNLKVLRWTGLLIPLVPVLWFLTIFMTKINLIFLVSYLFVEELFSGFIWAGFNLSASNFIYDAVTRQRFTLCASYYNFLNGIGIFVGATLGGIISSYGIILGMSSILFIFLLSALARFIFYLVMISKIKEVRKVEEYKDGEFRNEIIKTFIPVYKSGSHSI